MSDEIPPMPEFDMSILMQIFHDTTEIQLGEECVHRNQHLGGKDCGLQALAFAAEYARLWSDEYGDDV